MALLFNILGVAGVAAFTTWLINKAEWMEGKKASRGRLFLIELGHNLVRAYIDRRLLAPRHLRSSTKAALTTLDLLDRRTLVQQLYPPSHPR